MDATVVVAAFGFIATVLAAWLTSRSQRLGDREGRLLDAKVRTYGECYDRLYEYVRATFNRVKARLDAKPDDEREGLRQEAYRCNARARSAIGQVAILSGDDSLRERLEKARHAVGGMNDAVTHADLRARHNVIHETLNGALDIARADLMR